MTHTCLVFTLLIPIGVAAAEKITTGPVRLVAESGAREGPSWDPSTGTLYFVSGNDVNRLTPQGPTLQGKVEPFRTDAPGANGTLIDPQGRVLVCEAAGRRVTRTGKDGTLTVLAERYEGKKFNSPNDLALDSKGRIYFTDPRYGPTDTMEIKDASGKLVEGVYRIDPPLKSAAPGKITRILAGQIGAAIERPNGILVSPDDHYLYIADNYNNRPGGARKLYRFDLKPDATVDPSSRKLIFDWKTARGPDGFKMDRKGRLYVAAGLNKPSRFETTDEFKGGVSVLSPEGALLEFIPLPVKDETTNCAFGGKDLKTLFITSGDQLWSVPVNTPGRISARP
jgi:gluconolactonase